MPSQAAENIGGATIVVNEVSGALPTGNVTVVQGDQVFRDEGVHTEANSSTKLVLRDNTNLSLGPNTSLKLDRFVYAGAQQPGAIAINLAKGVFRFATGNADKQAYAITTPTAAIGVRGTVLKILATAIKTTIVLEEGEAHVCARGSASCLDMTRPNDRVVVTNSVAAADHGTTDPTGAIFAAFCQGGMCLTTPYQVVKADITNLLSTHASADVSLAKEVRGDILSDPSLIDALLDVAKTANSAQQAAIGAGLGQAARSLVVTDPQAATAIQKKIALSGLEPLIIAYNFTSGGTETGALGGGAGGGGAAAGGAGGQVGGFAGAGSGGGNTGGGSGSNNNNASFSTTNGFAGFTGSGPTRPGSTPGFTGGGTTVVSTLSVSPSTLP